MPNGILVIDKPGGWTSRDVVNKVRNLTGEKKVGHAGTLDPMATGVLPIFLGRATRASDFLMQSEKEYEASLLLGLTTNTQDTTGEVIAQSKSIPERSEVEKALHLFEGKIQQIPPMYSALKYNGKRLYELARNGVEVERKPRPITIFYIRILTQISKYEYRLLIRCSKGTYIRTLCNDIGLALGCGGVMSALRRTEDAGFTIEQAITLEHLQQKIREQMISDVLMPIDSLFSDIPAYTVTGAAERLCRHGNPFPTSEPDGQYRIYGSSGEFYMLGKAINGTIYVTKNFMDSTTL